MPNQGPGRPPRPFPRSILAGPTLDAARALLGARLVREPDEDGDARRVGRIVEVEAYIGEEDRASHARMGPTARNRVMFGPPAVAYVYLVYGMHHCLNVVTEPVPRPAAVLIRAVEPLEGIDAMRVARDAASTRPRTHARRPGAPARARAHAADERLAAGPGLVAAAFSIDRSHTGLDLCDPASPLRLEAAPEGEPSPDAVATPRIGIAYAGEPWASVPWRLIDPRSPSLSGRVR
ncbi:MAG TPA: DNA-3-methyladenine glycosylase [Candidatus Limnocylindrales bacterium]|nr:DNA-3-methyladenine glycosylase [Candidatus Limnocylindrales bacterium]